jgi:putative peptidoglycan lipid II flippase
MFASFASIGLNLVLNISLMWVLGYLAFPLSTSLAAVLNVGLLYALLPRKVGPFERRSLAVFAAKLALASAAGGGAAWAANRIIVGRIGVSFLASAGSVVAGGALGLAVFFLASRLLGITETRDFVRRFLRK